MTYDAGDPEQVRAARKMAKAAGVDQDNMIRAIMDLPQGRKWVWEILTRCKVFQTTFDRNGLTMAFQAGEQNIGQGILADIMRVCPERYLTMTQEQNSGRRDIHAGAGPSGGQGYARPNDSDASPDGTAEDD
jgi:hypothetical protein